MISRSNRYLVAAILVALAVHGSTMFYTLQSTYDALIHLFFAEHYATNWFDPWNEKWYTGFSVMSYPPLVHQLIAIFSFALGLKTALYAMTLLVIVLFVTGVYRFALLLTQNKASAGYAAILAVFSSAFIEALHIFGQLPTLFGIALLLHALPFVYRWILDGKKTDFYCALGILGVAVTSHHVTPIFGMVFFIFPTIGLALFTHARVGIDGQVTLLNFWKSFKVSFLRIISFGLMSLVLIIGCILPYWINTKNNPITQIPIPHGSRDNFLEVLSSGLVFFIIPWGLILLILPYIFIRFHSRRLLFFGLSFSLLFLLGTGGTTPLPRMILGDTAFNILTLDRFTFWAAVMAMPLAGEFFYRLIEGDYSQYLRATFGKKYHRFSVGTLSVLLILVSIATITLGSFRPSQPAKIEMLPIVNFLHQDEHDHWRYLTLGFGDQMAWLATQTSALSVDGNYHSARRLPELTSRAVERLENSKFRGIEGLGSLQQFLTIPEKYHLKYIFSNDKFYDPLLYFCGWQRLVRLENGIQVWEKLNVPPLPAVFSRDTIAPWQKFHWGFVPSLMVCLAALSLFLGFRQHAALKHEEGPSPIFRIRMIRITHWGAYLVAVTAIATSLLLILGVRQHSDPENVVLAYYNALDFKNFKEAHSYIDPEASIDLDQYMLEVSVSDGLMSSYAKLDSINVDIKMSEANRALASVHATYISPLKKILITEEWNTVRRDGKWFLSPREISPDLPPRKFISSTQPDYFLQGRRKTTTESTSYEDVLKQPEILLLSASLVRSEAGYSIVGRVRNIDHVPADVVIEGLIFDSANTVMAKYNAKDVMKHKLLPSEETGFRVDFEELAWIETASNAPATFDPLEFNGKVLETPARFSVRLSGNVTASDLDKSLVLARSQMQDSALIGTLFNSGTSEITVPQILTNYYNHEGKIIWVQADYINEGVRQQRKLDFNLHLKSGPALIISDQVATWSINGRPGNPPTTSNIEVRTRQGQAINDSLSITIDLNSFIGNP